ncbi:hypothetical protein V2I01_12285 [Micromonospora sp. BRA006-A]|nr:hypothetical protein [Micromonospora sp. BRA006-A]
MIQSGDPETTLFVATALALVCSYGTAGMILIGSAANPLTGMLFFAVAMVWLARSAGPLHGETGTGVAAVAHPLIWTLLVAILVTRPRGRTRPGRTASCWPSRSAGCRCWSSTAIPHRPARSTRAWPAFPKRAGPARRTSRWSRGSWSRWWRSGSLSTWSGGGRARSGSSCFRASCSACRWAPRRWCPCSPPRPMRPGW